MQRDLIQFTLISYSDLDMSPQDLEYSLTMKEWTTTYMSFNLNFTNPMKISAGKENDLLVLRVKSLNLFSS